MSRADQRLKQLYWNMRLLGLPEPVRDLWMLIVTALVVLALVSIQSKADTAKVRADHAAIATAQQREGRRVAIQANCGIEQAIIDAGRVQLTRRIAPGRFRRNLERLGYPTQKAAAKMARAAGEGYSRAITSAVERASGVKGIVGPDGRLRCERLVRAADASHRP